MHFACCLSREKSSRNQKRKRNICLPNHSDLIDSRPINISRLLLPSRRIPRVLKNIFLFFTHLSFICNAGLCLNVHHLLETWSFQFCCSQLNHTPHWRNHTPTWVSIEAHLISLPINLYIYSASKQKLLRQTKNPFLKNTLMVWHKVLAYLEGTTSLSQ